MVVKLLQNVLRFDEPLLLHLQGQIVTLYNLLVREIIYGVTVFVSMGLEDGVNCSIMKQPNFFKDLVSSSHCSIKMDFA